MSWLGGFGGIRTLAAASGADFWDAAIGVLKVLVTAGLVRPPGLEPLGCTSRDSGNFKAVYIANL